MTLKYIPAGFTIQAIPARDLTDEEVEQWGEEYLLATGLYVRPEPGDTLTYNANIEAKYTESGDLYFTKKKEPETPAQKPTKRKNKKG
jgi:hypothetical protein